MDFSNFPLYDSQICPLLLCYNDQGQRHLLWMYYYTTTKFEMISILQYMKDDVLLKLAQNLEHFMSHGQKK